MRKFILVVLIFSSPFILFFASVEVYCRTKTTFAIKKHYLESNLNSIEVLFLGSSHSQNAINPEFISKKSCNLAYGGQPISIEYFLLDKYIDKIPHLKTVFFEISPHRFYNDLNISDWNGRIYVNLYGIDYSVKELSIKNYSLLFSNFKYFTSIFYDFCNPFANKYDLNEFGFVINNFSDRFYKLKYDPAEIKKTFKMPHTFKNMTDFKKNINYLDKIIERCKVKNIEIIFITTPFYKTYLSQIPIESKNRVDSITRKYVTEFGIKYFDFSKDSTFTVYDFKDDNHLNSLGAKKFSSKIDRLLHTSEMKEEQ